MKLAVQFGAGNIGRGFLGQLLFESGYKVVFVDIVPQLVHLLNVNKQYPIQIVGNDSERIITVENVDALLLTDKDKVIPFLEKTDLIATAVGVNGLESVVEVLAEGLQLRLSHPNPKPVNILICENLPEPKKTVEKMIKKYLPPEMAKEFDKYCGLVEASIGRMVPVMTDEEKKEDPLLIRVEEYCELPVDKDGFVGEIPQIKNLKPYSPFIGYVHRKLYLHNLTHAVCAYLGALKGYQFVWEAIGDEIIRKVTFEAGLESVNALCEIDRLPKDELLDHLNDLLKRYGNRKLNDQIVRVARDPIRKLGPEERLVGSARYCLKINIVPENIALGIASAIFYPGEDESSIQLQKYRRLYGVEGVLIEVCKVKKDESLFELVNYSVDELKRLKLLQS